MSEPKNKKKTARIRFYRCRRPFEHSIKLDQPIDQQQAEDVFRRSGWIDLLVNAHAWIAVDLAARFLHARDLPSHLGEELASVGVQRIWKVLASLKTMPRNLKAYLSEAVERAMWEYIETDSLCYVPGRTRRDRAAKDRPKIKAPSVLTIRDFPNGFKLITGEGDTGFDSDADILDALRKDQDESWRRIFDLHDLEDVYWYCEDQLDRDLIRLRYDNGAGPRCLEECAGVLGQPYRRMESRLDAIETRLYVALERRKPTRCRQPGTRRNSWKKSA